MPRRLYSHQAVRFACCLFFIWLSAGSTALAVEAEPQTYRLSIYRAPVPDTLSGARVVGVSEAEALWRSGKAVFIDVYPRPPKPPQLPETAIWRWPQHTTIKRALWWPNVGYGVLNSEMAALFKRSLGEVQASHPGKALVFFCESDCWMSWNAAKRALEFGAQNVVWFPSGIDSWSELDLPTEIAEPGYPAHADR